MNEIIKRNDKIAPWGHRDTVREMAERLKLTMPGARKLDAAEATALAQIAIAHGLDPFNGEAWFIPGSGVMVGIKGLRKAARKQLRGDNGKDANFWTEFKRVPDPKEYGADDEDLVYECRLRDDATFESWARVIERFKKLGMELDVATGHAGPAPITVGIGIFKKGEATRMQPNEAARKRAEANAIKQRFDVEFSFGVDTDFIDAPYEEIVDEVVEEKKSAEEINAELGFEEEKPERPYSPEKLKSQMMKKANVAQNNQEKVTGKDRQILAAQLNTLCGGDEKRHAFCEWLVGKESTKDMPANVVYALLKWLEVDDFDIPPSDIVIAEAKAALVALR